MHRLALAAALVASVTSAGIAPRPASAQDLGIAVGSPAPSAQVVTLDGKPLDLKSLAAKGPVLVEFWATWCPNCKELEPTVRTVAQKYAGKVQFVTVAVSLNQSLERVKRHQAKYNMPGLVVYDAKGQASLEYDAPATSYVVVLGKGGKVVYTGLGGKQDLDAAIRKAL